MFYLSRVQLKNVRCFADLDISFGGNIPGPGWSAFVGDNATGKSTLLRAIAMGLCDEASAAGLLKESDEGYIRRGSDKATITIDLCDPECKDRKVQITTTVSRQERTRGIFVDVVRQETLPPGKMFPWDDIFVSGYGAGRGVVGTGDISGYSTIDAVYNMFNYTEGLQNPELVIRRLTDRSRSPQVAAAVNRQDIMDVLRKFTHTDGIRLSGKGLLVDGPWGPGMPFRDLPDGYRSSFLWLADLIGWALAFKPRTRTPAGIRGIVLVDEIEQHLHARWQRTVVDDLRTIFPNVQFLCTTHSPLIALAIGNCESEPQTDRLFVLEEECGGVLCQNHDFMKGWRMDQVLASRAFRYQIDSSPDVERILRRGSELASKDSLTPDENREYNRIKQCLRGAFLSTTTPIERAAEIEANAELRDEIKRLEEELLTGNDS